MKASKDFYNRFGLYFFLGTMVFSSLWVLYYIFFNNSIDLGEIPDSQAVQIAQEGSPAKDEKAPLWVSTDTFTLQGSKIYKVQCALCHGAKGLGDGTPGLVPPPRNLVKGKWKQGGSSKDLFVTLQKGVPASSMVSFQHLPKADRWALVHYIRSITKNQVPDNMKELEDFAKDAL